MQNQCTLKIFIDDNPNPIGEYTAPVSFEIDSSKLIDGEHFLKIVSISNSGKEGIRIIPFTVRNGPAISIEGISENAVVDGIVPLMINAYSKGDQKKFLIEGSETPRSIPAWLWAIIIMFVGWSMYYFITSALMKL